MKGIYIDSGTIWDKPASMLSVGFKTWTWENVKEFIESL